MKRSERLLVRSVCACVLLACFTSVARADAPPAQATGPRVFLLDGKQLAANKQRQKTGDAELSAALQQLESQAAGALSVEPFSVVSKTFTPPSGDKHDYMSQAPYFWPNPNTADGLPYIRKDGERNPDREKYRNRPDLSRMSEAVETLALAYYFTEKEEYAQKATQLIRAWFLDPETKMNPNFQYAQAIPGVNTGRGIGIIESREFVPVIDAVGLLAGSKAWTAGDQKGFEEWFTKYLAWLQESKNGHDESMAKNNHGTYYDVQVAVFAMFLGKDDVAKAILENVGQKRIAVQVEPDGRQPLELARTKAWGYSTGNLNGLMTLAWLGERFGIDLWSFQTPDGRSIRKALDFLAPYAAGEKQWDYQQLGGWSPRGLDNALRRAATKYPDGSYRQLAAKIPDDSARRKLVSAPNPPS